MFLTDERKKEIKKNIMLNFDKVMVGDITDTLEELVADIRVKARKMAAEHCFNLEINIPDEAESKLVEGDVGEWVFDVIKDMYEEIYELIPGDDDISLFRAGDL